MAAHIENLEKCGNLKVMRENVLMPAVWCDVLDTKEA